MNNKNYLIALHSIDGFGPIRLKAILDYFKDPKLAWQATEGELIKIGIPKPTIELFLQTRKRLEPDKYVETIKAAGIKWISIFDDAYPKILSQIYNPPIIIYYKGEINWNDKSIAIVGTRKVTGYGKTVTEQFSKGLSDAGLIIVSGLAKGVDSVAHKTTVENNGKTIAVLGSGLNNIFPPENQKLAEEITCGYGVVISEFPPDYPSMPGNFPARNRIISGLSLGVLVAEAAEDSGSLITARFALEQGREVFAVPGPITSSLSKGPIDLIKEGAKLVVNAQDVLDELGVTAYSKKLAADINSLDLSKEEKEVLQCLENENMHIDEIGRKLSLNAAKISSLLLRMEIAGMIQNLGGGNYCRLY